VGYGYRYHEVPGLVLPKVRENVEISVPREDRKPDERRPVSVSLGCHVDGVSMPKPDLGHASTMVAGVCKRFAGRVPAADKAAMARFRLFVRHYIRRHYTPLTPDVDTSIRTWLAATTYPEWRKRELLEKLEAYHRGELTLEELLACASFMKDEFYLEYKHGRGINARHDVFKCLVGPIFKLIEEEVYKDHHFIKHVPVAKRPEFIRDLLMAEGVRFYASDYTSFEALFTRELMEACEFELYSYMTQHLDESSLMKWACESVLGGDNICNFKDFTVWLEAVRMSGEMCTSLGNGFTNLMAFLFVAQEKGSTYADGVVEGDDGLFALNGPPPTPADFEKLGLVIKLEEHQDLSTASFCGLIFDPHDLVNIACPRKILAGFGWAAGQYVGAKPKILKALLRCKALSLAHQYPGAPIISALARYGLRVTDDVQACKMYRVLNARAALDEWHRRQVLQALESEIVDRPVPINTRLLMESKFGISVTDQIRIEEYLNGLNSVVPLKIDVDLFSNTWIHYWDVYVKEAKWGRRPELAVANNGLNIYTLFNQKGGRLVPRRNPVVAPQSQR